MTNPKFRLEVSYNETTGEPIAAYVRVREGKPAQTKEIKEGAVFADYGPDGSLLGIELLEPCGIETLERAAEKEPNEVRQFLRHGVRKEMIFA
jgi:uncharacterized protein YuzE